MSRPFWEYLQDCDTSNFDTDTPEVLLSLKAVSEGLVCYTHTRKGQLIKPVQDLLEELDKWPRLRLIKKHTPQFVQYAETYWFCSDDTSIWIPISQDGDSQIEIATTDKAMYEQLVQIAQNFLKKRSPKGSVSIVAVANGDPYLHELRNGGEDFVPENYRPEVVESYRHIISDLNNPNPCGRLVIFDGNPGVGKTRMVRAILNEVPQGTFVLVPSSAVSTISSPGFVRVLLNAQRKDHPIILVIEDADEALAGRKADTMSEVSALLNYSDGLFGSILDIRVIATTNTSIDEIDDATKRDGRLCRRIEVTKLGHTQAEGIYKRLGGTQAGLFRAGDYFTLAQIYRWARGTEEDLKPLVKVPRKQVGFALDLKVGDVVTDDRGKPYEIEDEGESAGRKFDEFDDDDGEER